ncbi:hypothetical protein CERSUDRAFT_127907 [Gelatoporia subvermispora B]|uniref:ABC transporter domain-containing protein n=1 Tax=Ceriporiopsis subvermispora (strain B) TaxID=914234 RepID=M2RA07_CERS8|nr:hypothetical protein CERSUDRAFT_127907 [Gelatoporia subvermispora B]
MDLLKTFVYIIGQTAALLNILRQQPDALMLAAIMIIIAILQHAALMGRYASARVWAETTENDDYSRMRGYKQIVTDLKHRKELVAVNLAGYLISHFTAAAHRLGDDEGDYYELSAAQRDLQSRRNYLPILSDPLAELPQILFTLRAARHPASIPVSLASLHLISQSTSVLAWQLRSIFLKTRGIASQLADLRKVYDLATIPNSMQDGAGTFSEDAQKIRSGVCLEFRNVSFRYPGCEKFALHKISEGQLCVIVGSNGSGKSTILKLAVRLYDPEEGEILLDGRNIKDLKLYDVRQAVSVLFEDYTHFPLSIRENIALGDPEYNGDNDQVERAAALGGASEFIAHLYGDLPSGTHSLFGRRVDYQNLRNAGGMSSASNMGLSGGQMQILAVSRTFMRSVTSDKVRVGLLLFDEPSASLDPTPEHELFATLRELRGDKTMVFSSHRFGNLTRHADIILYINDSTIVESGTHEQLLIRNGEYGRLWKLQVQAFL